MANCIFKPNFSNSADHVNMAFLKCRGKDTFSLSTDRFKLLSPLIAFPFHSIHQCAQSLLSPSVFCVSLLNRPTYKQNLQLAYSQSFDESICQNKNEKKESTIQITKNTL